ncbi:MAG: adenosylcobinamide amidohydrolase, partial [Methanothrix sp.]|nr:adenosylcobinamide amidohydrolase [Methanothrix sp.]
MRLAEFYGGIEVHREEKIIFVSLLRPHRVLSTSRSSAGGLRDDLLYIYNHQSCEPAGGHMVSAGDPDEYKRLIAGSHDLPFQRSASLGTCLLYTSDA